MILRKVISGGQVGADIASLKAAKAWGLETSGFAPKGFRTLEGDNPLLGKMYGLVEIETREYPPRTFANVNNSDGTIRFAFNLSSPGELCTLRAIITYGKPSVDVLFYPQPLSNGWRTNTSAKEVADWIREFKIETLNVAGNAKVEIEPLVEQFLETVFRYLTY